MPTFVLYVRAELENIATLSLVKGVHYCIDVKESAGSEQRDGVHVSAAETHDLAGSKGTANFVMKFDKASRHEAYCNVMEIKGVTRDVTGEDSGQWVPVIALECRGLEPVGYHPGSEWTAVGSGGSKFEEVDLKEDWADYDEKAGDSVSIMGLESKFELHKGK